MEGYLAGETVDAARGKVDVTWNDTDGRRRGAWEDFAAVGAGGPVQFDLTGKFL
jgi:hypothetical protein